MSTKTITSFNLTLPLFPSIQLCVAEENKTGWKRDNEKDENTTGKRRRGRRGRRRRALQGDVRLFCLSCLASLWPFTHTRKQIHTERLENTDTNPNTYAHTQSKMYMWRRYTECVYECVQSWHSCSSEWGVWHCTASGWSECVCIGVSVHIWNA